MAITTPVRSGRRTSTTSRRRFSAHRQVNKAMLSKTLAALVFLQLSMQCIPGVCSSALEASEEAIAPAQEKMAPIDAWTAVAQMTPGINIGNTLENTVRWETGWGNPA